MNSFEDVVKAQTEFESLFYDFNRLHEQEYLDHSIDYLTTSLAREAFELKDEINWKQHGRTKPVNMDKAREEAIDCLTFSLDTCILLGMDASDIIEWYFLKNRINWDRQVEQGRVTKEQAEEIKSRYMEV